MSEAIQPVKSPVSKLPLIIKSATVLIGRRTKVGASFTASTVMVNVLVLLSEPPSAMPPLSCAITVTVAAPKVLAAGVNVSVPLSATLGGTLNNAALSLLVVTLVTLWPDSFAEPAVKVAKPLTE